ncbi:MAG: hypothetical protein KatS3mg003_0671 [Candidatus Nitrosocaldaceae archaeon]|nr:MAG: hypothetical protein KatS3mg003_0671 [Candidatus Nitrosocaldaceae archaeon]
MHVSISQTISIITDSYSRNKLLEDFVALLFIPEYQKATMLIGPSDNRYGNNGKNTYLVLIESMLGYDNVSHISLQDLEYNRFATAELDGKLANIFADIKRLELTSTSILKALISKILLEKKFANPFTLHPKAKLIFSCNELPEVNDHTDAWFRRWSIHEFLVKFDGKEDLMKAKRLINNQDNLDILFTILINIAHRIKKKGLLYLDDTNTIREK